MTHETPPESIVPEGLPPASWAAIGAEPVNGGWRIPERDAEGETIGWSRRFPDGSKKFEFGGHRGLTMPSSLSTYGGSTEDEPIFVVEGATDTAALHGLGLDAVGRPSAFGGVNHLAKRLRNLHVCIIGENDGTAGAAGAFKVANGLNAACMSVKVIFPPPEAKDAREWVAKGATKETLLTASKTAPAVADSILPPMEGGLGRIEFNPVPVTELGPSEPPDWHWPGYIAAGHMTLFIGLWKAGKSTLLAWACRDMAAGGRLVQEPIDGRILVVSEESRSLWRTRAASIGLPPTIEVGFQESFGKPSLATWLAFIERVRHLAREKNYRVVVFDTVSSFWPVVNENDASEVVAAVMPLRALTRDGVAVVLIHHPRKGGGEDGQASRGSGALPGTVDIIVEFGRASPGDAHDRRRVLKCLSRFEDSPKEVVVELTDDGYIVIGDRAQSSRKDRQAEISALLPTTPPGLTLDEIRAKWPSQPAPGKSTVASDLEDGVASGLWSKTGSGYRGSPFRFVGVAGFDSPSTGVLRAGIESHATGDQNGEAK